MQCQWCCWCCILKLKKSKKTNTLCQIHFFRYCNLENKFPLNLNILTEHRFIFFHWISKFCKKLKWSVGWEQAGRPGYQAPPPLFVVERNFSNRTFQVRPGPASEMFSISHILTSHQKLKRDLFQFNNITDISVGISSAWLIVPLPGLILSLSPEINAVLGMSRLWWSSGGRQ